MIGRWLALLTEQEEDNLLTTKLVPFTHHAVLGTEHVGCLVGVALKHQNWGGMMCVGNKVDYPARYGLWLWWDGKQLPTGLGVSAKGVAWRFNELCQKLAGVPHRLRRVAWSFENTPAELLGGARAAALIRARILRHRAQRALAAVKPPHEQAEPHVPAGVA